jgi:hypothetical protein
MEYSAKIVLDIRFHFGLCLLSRTFPWLIVTNLDSKQTTQRAIILFCSNLSTRVWFLCALCSNLVSFGCMWALLVAPLCLCYRTSKSGMSDHGFQRKTRAQHTCITLRVGADIRVIFVNAFKRFLQHTYKNYPVGHC